MLNYFFYKVGLNLVRGKSFSGGRNFLGRVCVKGRCSGNKRLFRSIDFFKRLNVFGTVCRIIYDKNRTAPIVYILYENGLACYSILVEGLKIGSSVFSGYDSLYLGNIGLGWSIPLLNMPLFSVISSIELYPFLGAKICRAAGSCAVLIGKTSEHCILKLRSGWIIYVSLFCFSVYGKVSKSIFNAGDFMKAGKMRAFGFKSKVRGVAKNPCDHPHGGGNGKKSKPPVPVNAWGRFAKWLPTKNTKSDKLKRRMFKFVDKKL
jgi:large subunit ribosomal protein L2